MRFQGEHDDQIEAELAIIMELAREGLKRHYYDDEYPAADYFGEDIRLSHVLIMPVFLWTDDEGEHETVLPMCTSKSTIVKYGIIELGMQALDYKVNESNE